MTRHPLRDARAITGVLLLAAAAATAFAQTAEWRYVAGSRVNLRAQPQAGAPVVAVLEINEKLQFLRSSGTWCEVRRDGVDAIRGHVACELLAAQPLRLEDVEDQLAKAQAAKAPVARRLDLTARAFWLSPSLERWERHGGTLEQTLSETARFERDPKTEQLKRPANAEFDAMKAFLASGRMRVERTRPMALDAVGATQGVSAQPLEAALRRLPLPAASASFFGAEDLDALVPSGWTMAGGNVPQPGAGPSEPEPYQWANSGDEVRMIDAMSKRFASRLKVTVTGPAWVNRADEVQGFWDVGAVRLEFAPGAVVETMGNDGRLRSLPVAEMTHTWGSHGCLRSATQIVKPLRPRGAPGLDGLMLAWVGRKPAAAQASIASRQRDGKTPYDRLVVHVVDIDGDRRPDAVVYEGRYKPTVSATGLWKAVFANVAGRWALVWQDQDDDCT